MAVDEKFVKWLKEVKRISWHKFKEKDIDERIRLKTEYDRSVK